MSAWILLPIGIALVIVWHEWRQRKLPWPDARKRVSADVEAIRERIRRGETVSLDEGLQAIGASRADIVDVYVPTDRD